MDFIVFLKGKSEEFPRPTIGRLLEPPAHSTTRPDSDSFVCKTWLRPGASEACVLVAADTLESALAQVAEFPGVKSGTLETVRILPLRRQRGEPSGHEIHVGERR
jgi:hypothetical protein